MPLVKIDMIKGVRSPEEIKKLADIVQEIMLDKFAAPARDRYQVLRYERFTLHDKTVADESNVAIHN